MSGREEGGRSRTKVPKWAKALSDPDSEGAQAPPDGSRTGHGYSHHWTFIHGALCFLDTSHASAIFTRSLDARIRGRYRGNEPQPSITPLSLPFSPAPKSPVQPHSCSPASLFPFFIEQSLRNHIFRTALRLSPLDSSTIHHSSHPLDFAPGVSPSMNTNAPYFCTNYYHN